MGIIKTSPNRSYKDQQTNEKHSAECEGKTQGKQANNKTQAKSQN
ncbi:hypothetical protein COLO4_28402 [Corchorus olitorius]|uniref:Uncharacterized protein n=1 Tax=Corchorus olitorius TaxID=93759 RepID=A0A1R3HKZ9_9ROSI|nr:hypothetical protein COLO4_28402 [Corchorus olitorius]